MLRKILKCDIDSMTDPKFREGLDLITSDIKTNRITFGKRTSLYAVIMIAKSCFEDLQRRERNP